MTHPEHRLLAFLTLVLCGALGCTQSGKAPHAAQPEGGPPGNVPSAPDAGREAAPPDASEETAGRDASAFFDGGEQPGPRPLDDAGALDGGGGENPVAIGDGGSVHATILVRAGETFHGHGKRYTAGAELGDGSQSESQKPMFKLEDGAKLVNVVLGAPAADGIHTYGDAMLENIVWEDIGEDALTIKESGTVVLDGGSATLGEDKVFQINAPSTFRVSNFTASHAGKFIRQNGGTSYKVEIYIDRCDISHMDEAIFRTDSDVSTVHMTNTRYSAIGDELFMGVAEENITLSNNTPY